MREGDRITELNGREIGEARDLIDALNALPGETAELVVRRGEESETICVRPELSCDGQWMLGLWLRDQSAGIGTLTFYDPASGVYGALGHGVTDESSGEVRCTIAHAFLQVKHFFFVFTDFFALAGCFFACYIDT